ncbi:hypothetical protein [Chryseobacterium pennipullorum]|uniref:Uncharacterized protein n=1 Tax=Chryseobacterium pennipullorum TaxID=2258963 RepID=A0A3D9AJH4_9FLAO|nr:hypothetical protein [Chryseobacterium pennipullorum]REC41514.1 hypothetical protein DRF67_21220 [Chryseobacterium pennipullorum]
MKLLYTNWINIVGVFIVSFLFTTISDSLDPNVSRDFFQTIIASLIGILLYGMLFWICFIIALIILDLFLIVFNQKHLKIKLFLEWILISSPFIYWALKYPEQRALYIVAVVTFFITQLLRRGLINKATH